MLVNLANGEVKEEDIVHYLVGYMEIRLQGWVLSNVGLDEDIIQHVFH
jgi:hypothetical protein